MGKYVRIALCLILPLAFAALVGCSTTVTETSGTNFDTAKVAEIKKGVTTVDELVALLGQPFSKSVKTETDAEWVYSWMKTTVTVTSGWSVGNFHTLGHKKRLSVLVRNDVVINYVYDEGPFESNTKQEVK